jgi:ankyrin repeat protein
MISLGANDFNSGLSCACYGCNIEIIQLMISLGADDFNGGLSNACKGGHMDIVKLMISLGANDFNQSLLNASISKMNGDGDKAKSTDIMLLKEDGTTTRRIVLSVLPNEFSRGNTPSRSYEVQSLIKSKKGSGNLSIHLCGYSNLNADTAKEYIYAQAVSVGRCFPDYSLKSNYKPNLDEQCDIIIHFDDDSICSEISYTIDSIRLAQRLVDMPPNLLHTDSYVEEAINVASAVGSKINVIKGEDLEKGGFGGIWGVGKASEHLPALVILSHIPENSNAKKSICDKERKMLDDLIKIKNELFKSYRYNQAEDETQQAYETPKNINISSSSIKDKQNRYSQEIDEYKNYLTPLIFNSIYKSFKQ